MITWDFGPICRRVPFGGATADRDFIVLGLDWSAADFWLQVRPAAGGSDTPLVDLATATAGSEGISADYDAAYLDPETGEEVGATIIRPQIDQATLEAISWGQIDPDQQLSLVYDLHVQPPGEPVRLFAAGAFPLQPGVTIR